MAPVTGYLDISAWRNDDWFEYPVRVVGPDLTSMALVLEIRRVGDTSGPALVHLNKVPTASTEAQGLRIAGVSTAAQGQMSDLRIRIDRPTLQDLPYYGALGDAADFEYALLIGGRTRLRGKFILPAHAYGSDNAPADRPERYGDAYATRDPGPGATLTISQDGGATVIVDGADLVGIEVGKAQAIAAQSEAAAIAAQAALSATQKAAQAFSAIKVIGRATLSSGTNATAGIFVFAPAVDVAAVLPKLRVRGGTAGGPLKLCACSRSGDTFTIVGSQDFAITANADNVLTANLPVEAGQFVGLAVATDNVFAITNEVADQGGWYSGGYNGSQTSFTDATVSTGQRLQVGVDISYPGFTAAEFATLKANSAVTTSKAIATEAALSEPVSSRIGVSGDPFGTLAATANTVWMLSTPSPRSGPVSLDIDSLAAGTVVVTIATKSGSTFTRVISSAAIAVSVGLNRITAAMLGLTIEAGQCVGVITGAAGTLSYAIGTAAPSSGFAFSDSPAATSFTDGSQPRTNLILSMGFNVAGTQLIPVASRLAALGGARTGYFSHALNFLNNYGESLAEGSNSPAVTTVKEYDSSGFAAHANAPSSLLDATVANLQLSSRSEFPTLGTMGHLKSLIAAENSVNFADGEYQLVTCNNGWSGYKIADLIKGTTPYTLFLAQLDSLVTIATARSKTKAMQATALVLGHNDMAAGTNYATFYAALKQLATDIAADARAKTGQAFDPILVTTQTNSSNNITARGAIAKATLDAANDHPLIYCATPLYPFSYYDATHIDAISSKRVGGYSGLVCKRVIVDKGDWQPLQPVRHGVVGNAVDLFFSKDGLTFDTTIMPAQTDMGFSVVDAGGAAVAIVGIAIVGTNRVRLTFATPPQAGWRVRYGYNLVTGKANYVGGGGNLRDSAGDRLTYQGWAMHNWCCLFEYLV